MKSKFKALIFKNSCIKSLSEFSPDALIYLLIHKMDKVDITKRDDVFLKRKKQFELKAGKIKINCFPTSIWQNTIYKAWSNILGNIIPKIDKIKELLEKYTKACQADEVILFEKNILLYITSYNNKEIKDSERFEKICWSMKKFNNICKIGGTKYRNFIIKNIDNNFYLDDFENSTYIMVVFSNKNVSLELVKINLEICKKMFKDLMNN